MWPGFMSRHQQHNYVSWVCCWFSPLLRQVFLLVLTPVFPTLRKPTQNPIQSGMVDQEPLCGCATFKSFLFIYFSKFTLGTSIFFPCHSPSLRFNYIICYISIYTIMSGDSSNLCRAFLRRFPWFSYLI